MTRLSQRVRGCCFQRQCTAPAAVSQRRESSPQVEHTREKQGNIQKHLVTSIDYVLFTMFLTFLLMCLSKCLPKQYGSPVVFFFFSFAAASSPLTTCFVLVFYNVVNEKLAESHGVYSSSLKHNCPGHPGLLCSQCSWFAVNQLQSFPKDQEMRFENVFLCVLI